MTTSFFPELISRTDEARRSFENHERIVQAVADGMPLPRYQRLLLELYQLVWHFNPICAAAASRMSDDSRHVRYFFYKHIEEESGHERWVMDDLEAVGVSASDARKSRPMADTQALVGFNYWTADRREPVAVLGMVYVLEVIASVYGGPFSTAIKESLLLSGDRGVSFIGSHASLDTKHMADLRDILNTVQDESKREAICESTIVNFDFVTRIFSTV
ncbi:MAG TPA: iron-containing redox enzyme family protein [Caldimonas sp.]|nr:iron-containing redox enzyme family protein [Caldimonas sp.]